MGQVCGRLEKTKRSAQQKMKATQRQKEQLQREQKIREVQEKEWDLTRPTKRKKKTGEPQKKEIQKADLFQGVFEGIIWIIRELWFGRA